MGVNVFRWIAPLSVATTAFIEIAPLFIWVRDRIVFWLLSYKTIIYSDCEAGEALYESMRRKAVLHKECSLFSLSYKAKRSIIMMKSDETSLRMFRLLDGIENRFLCLNSMEPSLMPSSGNTVICNINDIIAGYFWHKDFLRVSGGVQSGVEELATWRERDGIHVFQKKKDRCFEIIIWGYEISCICSKRRN